MDYTPIRQRHGAVTMADSAVAAAARRGIGAVAAYAKSVPDTRGLPDAVTAEK
ncbi:MAG TPA: hypothetical protein VG142_10410 [Trebonia sp.]|jgi:hypothetical protein|nr:hypothetical protein [Trebonia sp.]